MMSRFVGPVCLFATADAIAMAAPPNVAGRIALNVVGALARISIRQSRALEVSAVTEVLRHRSKA
jgi:hypothetical protein